MVHKESNFPFSSFFWLQLENLKCSLSIYIFASPSVFILGAQNFLLITNLQILTLVEYEILWQIRTYFGVHHDMLSLIPIDYYPTF